MGRRPSKPLLALLAAIGILFCAPLASSKLLDPEAPAHAVLDALVDKVDSQGIDVSRRWNANPATLGERPVLTPLGGFTSASEAKAAQALWMRDFEGNIHSILVGVKENQPSQSRNRSDQGATDLATFKSAWERARKSQRVFISFTRADAAHAAAVRQALDSLGYTTFVYLGGTKESPRLAPAEAGHFFATAGHHFVIDTKDARRSPGVWFEKALLGRYGGPSGVDVGTRGSGGVTPPTSGKPDVGVCICNTYRNGVLVGSSRISPGTRCGAQVCGQ